MIVNLFPPTFLSLIVILAYLDPVANDALAFVGAVCIISAAFIFFGLYQPLG